MIRLDGPMLARAWLSVAAAASSDKEDPRVYKTVALEEHPTGVRLIATDRLLLLTSWVPDLEHLYGMGSREPGLATLPDRTAIAADIRGRARSMLGHILAVAGESEKSDYTHGDVEVSIDFDSRPPAAPAAQGGFPDMDPSFVVLRSPEVETVYVPAVEMEYVDWRAAMDAHTPKPTSEVAYHPDLLERLGKIRKHTDGPVMLYLAGHTKPTRIVFPKSDPEVSGIVYPTREQTEVAEP